MFFSEYVKDSSSAHNHHLLSAYDVIYVDACTWMSPEMGSFLQQAAPHILSSGHKLSITASVLNELRNCAPLKLAAQKALELYEQYQDYINTEPGEAAEGTADGEFVRNFFYNHNKRRQLLITHDQQLAADIANFCPTPENTPLPSTAVMTLWNDGDLISFSLMQQRKDTQARTRLEEMTEASPIYLDSTALANVNLPAFLMHLKAPLLAQGKKVKIITNSLSTEIRRIIAPLLHEYGRLIEILMTDPSLSETNALLGELYLKQENMGNNRLILVTDDVQRANELRSRRPKCDRFPYIDFMTINKYAYLSYLKLSEPLPGGIAQTYAQQPATSFVAMNAVPQIAPRHPYCSNPIRQAVHEPTMPRTQLSHYARPALRERKPAAYVPQLIGAIKSEDIPAMCNYIAKGASLRNGIITALCQNKDKCLQVLIQQAGDNIEPDCFSWWVTSFYSFTDPEYLAQNPAHFELLKMLISKSAPLTTQRESMETLAERVSTTSTAQEQLWQLIREALAKGAPANVRSASTQETLLQIAIRHKNITMVNYLQTL